MSGWIEEAELVRMGVEVGFYLVQVTVVLALGLGVARVWGWRPAVRHRVLVLGGVAALMLPVLGLGWRSSGSASGVELAPVFGGVDPGPGTGVGSKWSGVWMLGLAGLWILGVVVRGTRFLVSGWRVRILLRESSPIAADSRLARVSERVLDRRGLAGRVELREATGCAGPGVVGLTRPTILFPVGLARDLSDEQLRHVLLHEVAHVLRRDPLGAFLQQVFVALFWFHPLARVWGREVGRAREELCDNFVLREVEGAAYGRTLLGVAEFARATRPGRTAQPSITLVPRTWSLEERVASLLHGRRSTETGVGWRLSLGTGIAALALTAGLACTYPVVEGNANVAPGGDVRERMRAIERELFELHESGAATTPEGEARAGELMLELQRLQTPAAEKEAETTDPGQGHGRD